MDWEKLKQDEFHILILGFAFLLFLSVMVVLISNSLEPSPFPVEEIALQFTNTLPDSQNISHMELSREDFEAVFFNCQTTGFLRGYMADKLIFNESESEMAPYATSQPILVTMAVYEFYTESNAEAFFSCYSNSFIKKQGDITITSMDRVPLDQIVDGAKAKEYILHDESGQEVSGAVVSVRDKAVVYSVSVTSTKQGETLEDALMLIKRVKAYPSAA